MHAHEIVTRMDEVYTQLGFAYTESDEARELWQTAEADHERDDNAAYLKRRSLDPKMTQETLKRLSANDTYPSQMTAIRAETTFRKSQHHVDLLEKEWDKLRSLFSMEKVKLEKGVELHEPART